MTESGMGWWQHSCHNQNWRASWAERQMVAPGVKQLCNTTHWRNFTLKSGGDQWCRQDLVSGGHDDRGAEGGASRRQLEWGMGRVFAP